MVVERGVKKGPAMKLAIGKLFEIWKKSDYQMSAALLLDQLTPEDFNVVKPNQKVKR